MTNLAKAYIAVCVAGAALVGTVVTKVLIDITGIEDDVDELRYGALDDTLRNLDEGDDETEDVIAIMNAQNSAATADPAEA